jgi:hypothetical protein
MFCREPVEFNIAPSVSRLADFRMEIEIDEA